MKKLFLICLGAALLGFSGSACAQNDDAEYKIAVERFLVSSGAINIADYSINKAVAQLKETAPGTPAAYWTESIPKWTAKLRKDLVAANVPIYRKYFSKEELNQIIAFYENPAVVKLLRNMSAINAEALPIGSELGAEVGREIVRDMTEKGYLPKQ